MNNQDAIECLEYIHSCLDMIYANEQEHKSLIAVDMAIKALEQEPKTGRWIRHDNGKYHWYLCSCCDAMAGSDEKMMAYKYCPNCGVRMESEG